MSNVQSVATHLSEREQDILETLAKGTHSPLRLKVIILESATGRSNTSIAPLMNIRRNTVKKSRICYVQAAPESRIGKTIARASGGIGTSGGVPSWSTGYLLERRDRPNP